jgi:hypothetical protein
MQAVGHWAAIHIAFFIEENMAEGITELDVIFHGSVKEGLAANHGVSRSTMPFPIESPRRK